MFTLLKKEFLYFFSSATGYIVIGMFLLATGLFLWVFPGEYNIIDSGYAQMDGLFILAPWLYLFLVPAVTMRSFSEEKKSGTIELIYTRPISGLKIILAKYSASVLLVLFSLLPTLLYFGAVYLLSQYPAVNVEPINYGFFWKYYYFFWEHFFKYFFDIDLQLVGNVDTGGIFGSYIGLFFLAAVYVAIGIFSSAITDRKSVV